MSGGGGGRTCEDRKEAESPQQSHLVAQKPRRLEGACVSVSKAAGLQVRVLRRTPASAPGLCAAISECRFNQSLPGRSLRV